MSYHADYHVAVQELQKDLISAMEWLYANLIKFNASKTKLVCFRHTLKQVDESDTVELHTSTVLVVADLFSV